MNTPNFENFHIYLKSDKEKDMVLKDASPHEKYIILLNETLQTENRELRETITKNENAIETLEEDVDKLENSKRYMRGFLNNILIVEKLHKKKCEDYEKMLKSYDNYIYNINRIANKQLSILVAVLMAIMGIVYEFEFFNLFQYIFVCSIMICYTAFYNGLVRNVKSPDTSSIKLSINAIDKEIIELNKGQDFLHEYVEIM
jgi:hypothetical protein